MNKPTESAARDVKLLCLGGQVAPPEVLRDWKRFQALAPKAKQNIWEILTPSLPAAPDQAEIEKRGEAFCSLYRVSAQELQASVRVCRFLLLQASSLDLSKEFIREDLERLSGENHEGVEVVLSGYEEAKTRMRREILESTLFDHGKVFTGLDWRVDTIAASDRGINLNSPVVLLTLRYREGHRQEVREEAMTLYVVPEALKQLRSVCERIESMLEVQSHQ